MDIFESKNKEMKPIFAKMQDFMHKNGLSFDFGCNINSSRFIERFGRRFADKLTVSLN